MSFRCELQDVMASLLDATIMQILQLVQKDFLEKLKQNEQEINGLQETPKIVGYRGERDEETEEAEEETFQSDTVTEDEQNNKETETELSTNDPELIEEFAGNERNTKEDLQIIQVNEAGDAESDAETGGAGAVQETGSETFQSDVRVVGEVEFTDDGGNVGKENQTEKEGQKERRKRIRMRVKSEMEDGGIVTNEEMSSVDNVVLKLEDPLQVEGTDSCEDAESRGGAEHQVCLLEDHDHSCDADCCDTTSVKNLLEMKLPTSLKESTALHLSVGADSKLSEVIKRNTSYSSLATFDPQTEISEEYLAKAKVALTKMEGLPDRGWVLLDPLTGKFCIKDELDFKPEEMGRDGEDGEISEDGEGGEDGDGGEGPSADPSINGTFSVETGVKMTTNSSTQTEAQITVMMGDEFDKVNLNSPSAKEEEPNRVLTRSSKANRTNGNSTKASETNSVRSPRSYSTRSTGNTTSARTDECVEKSASRASCVTGSTPVKKVNIDRGKGNDRVSRETPHKVQQTKAKKDHNIKVCASETSKKNQADSPQGKRNIGKGKESHKFETRVYRSGHFIVSPASLTKNKKEFSKKSSGRIYTAKVKLCNASDQSFKMKNEPHSKGKVFECKHCAKTFPTLQYLKRHWQYHSPNKRHICSHCGKGFVYECHLKIHLQSHTKERPYRCNQCSKRFRYSSNLKYHLAYHTGEKPHVCQQCGMAFSRRGHLVKHITWHSGLKPYSCSHCEKTFAAKGGLTRHEQLHLKKQ
ncbi:zinc finger protein 37-like isoform X2 [Sardina pilchardus]